MRRSVAELGRRLFLAGLFALAGCAPTAPNRPPAAAAGFPLTVTDDSGRRVILPAPPRRIVSLAGAHTETLYALGLGERVVAADTYSDYPPEVRPKATIRCWPRPPVEPIVALRPDLVLVLTQEGAFLRELEAAGVPVLKLFPRNVEEALARIELLGRATGRGEAARALTARMRARFRTVRARVAGARRPRALFEMDATDPARPWVAGGGGFYGELIEMAGGRNVFGEIPLPAVQVGAEQIVARDPEVILLGDTRSPVAAQSPASVARRPGWARLRAVRAGRIHPVQSERITRPGPRLPEGLEEIARVLHPERFR